MVAVFVWGTSIASLCGSGFLMMKTATAEEGGRAGSSRMPCSAMLSPQANAAEYWTAQKVLAMSMSSDCGMEEFYKNVAVLSARLSWPRCRRNRWW